MKELRKIIESGLCPNCGSDNIGAIDYEIDDEIWFECYACHWSKTYPLGDAKEAGYYFFWGQPIEEDEPDPTPSLADVRHCRSETTIPPGEANP